MLSRMANEPYVEGLMWLGIGKMARKGGLYTVAQHSLTQANVSFCKSLGLNEQARESVGKVKLQVAKLKHAIGESTTALKLIEDDIPASIFLKDEKHLKMYNSSDENEHGLADKGATSHIVTIFNKYMTNVKAVNVCIVLGDGKEFICKERGNV